MHSEEPGKRILFFDDGDLIAKHGVHLVYGEVEKKGPAGFPVAQEDFSETFVSSVVKLPEGGYRAYYNGTVHESGVAVAHSADGICWEKTPLDQVTIDGIPTNRLNLDGLQDRGHVTQPRVVRDGNGEWFMWCWFHLGEKGYFRLVLLKSHDGLAWSSQGPDRVILLHPADKELGQNAWVAGLTSASDSDRFANERTLDFVAAKSLRTNDSCHILYNPERGVFEYYGVWLLPVDESTCRVTPHDNAPGVLRALHRRESEDGVSWSPPELILTPDGHDPLHQQFYYLNVHRENGWYIGFLGNYRCWEQTHDVELVFSRDGRQWQRPLRGGFFPRGAEGEIDTFAAYAWSNMAIDLDDRWRLLYRGVNVPHNLKWKTPNGKVTQDGLTARYETMAVEFPKGRFAGLRADRNIVGSVTLKSFIHTAQEISVDANVQGRLQAELRDVSVGPLEASG